jgi:hypothetical protein
MTETQQAAPQGEEALDSLELLRETLKDLEPTNPQAVDVRGGGSSEFPGQRWGSCPAQA